jgi:hypothetical protein
MPAQSCDKGPGLWGLKTGGEARSGSDRPKTEFRHQEGMSWEMEEGLQKLFGQLRPVTHEWCK